MNSVNPRIFLINQNLIEPHELPRNGEFRIECPKCHHHNRKCYVNGEGKGVDCKHCGYRASWYGFMRLFVPPTPEEEAKERFVQASHELLKSHLPAIEYLKDRGITEEVINNARIGYLPIGHNQKPTEADIKTGLYSAIRDRWFLEGRIIIPYIRDGYVVGVRGRAFDSNIEPKYAGLPGSKVQPYNAKDLDFQKPLFICEGEFDALLLSQIGYQAVGIPGSQTGDSFSDYFSKFAKIYLCLDNDESGRAATKKFLKLLPEVHVVDLPEDHDVSEYISLWGEESLTTLVENSRYYVGGKLQEDDSLRATITSWEDWAWTNGELLGPKIGWAPRLESALSGWSKGLFLIGAIANSGKSCFLVKSAYEAARSNPDDTVVVYLSLDDDREDAVCRLASLHTGISFEELRTPKISYDNPLDKSKRNPERIKYIQSKLEELKSMDNLIIRDARFGRSLQYIRLYCALLRKRYPEKYVVVLIDSLAKLTSENEPESISMLNWKAHLANELKFLSTLYNLCIVTPADFRKLNDLRRPTNDDLKDAAELAYEANCVLLGFNEVSLKGVDEATLKWTDPNTGQVWPILELNLSKNKKSMFRGAIRFKFFPPTSDFRELTVEEDAEFTRKIKENEQLKRGKQQATGPNFGAIPNFGNFGDLGRFKSFI